jgi:predicted RNA-binding Zn-ribbon protein involved in translation (DUF1610 family)
MGKVGKPFECQICGKVTLQTGCTQKYCRECSIIQRDKKGREYQKTKNKTDIELGVEFPCGKCGKTIIRKSSSHRYCSDCSPKVAASIPQYTQCVLCGNKIQKKGNTCYCADCREGAYKKRLNEHNQRRRSLYKVNAATEPQVMTNQKFTLAEVEEAARKHNLHYGEYVAKWNSGLVEAPEKIVLKKRGRKKAVSW